MNGLTSGQIAAAFGLFLFGIAYAVAVYYARKRGWLEGYTSLYVVLGVLVTIAGAAIPVNGTIPVEWLLLCFGASGTPMIIGDIAVYIKARQREMEAARNDATTPMA